MRYYLIPCFFFAYRYPDAPPIAKQTTRKKRVSILYAPCQVSFLYSFQRSAVAPVVWSTVSKDVCTSSWKSPLRVTPDTVAAVVVVGIYAVALAPVSS